ncbi:hypothetical protein SAMN05216388_1001199 [Halorientalis persicus]|jgi:uncharacterized membrane protein YeaQ/YmgE (transglycosylase-associated protein family)|uniref:Major facilitator superfamily (MFS) profile domain-containing protein n=1 Tax=Halorientalis persicus TaxID=1367881 RepID=A0A1H8D737_9EURY|nr:hypothetical protein [Halorientalis persicus]SEN03059.1 hypothetical protein SAMN05216388_1001199 [Halorientalis persicus]
MSQTASIDYQTYAKRGFFLGLALLLIGVVGSVVGHAFFEPLPAWENTLFVGAEFAGLLIGFFSPILFGIVLPLIE